MPIESGGMKRSATSDSDCEYRRIIECIGESCDDDDVSVQTPKRLRSVEPDLTIVVGGIEFHHYSIILCAISPYFDAMMASRMRESRTNRLEWPDRDPEQWELVYSFLDASHENFVDNMNRLKTGAPPMKHTELYLLEWFDFLQVKHLARLFDRSFIRFLKLCFATIREYAGERSWVFLQEQWSQCRHLPCPSSKKLLLGLMRYKMEEFDEDFKAKSLEVIHSRVSKMAGLLADDEWGPGLYDILLRKAGLCDTVNESLKNRLDTVTSPLFPLLVTKSFLLLQAES